MRINQEERRKLTAEDIEFVHRTAASGKFLLVDVFFYLLFFIYMFFTMPAPFYRLITLLFALYIFTSCICLLLRKIRRNPSKKNKREP